MSITTEEQRLQLAAAGWEPWGKTMSGCPSYLSRKANVIATVDRHDEGPLFAVLYPYLFDDEIQIAPILTLAAILQIPIPGYKIIREEGAGG